MTEKLRTVPDTNVILSAHQPSKKSPNKEYIDRWLKDEFVLLYSDDTLSEYVEKLFEKNVPEKLIEQFITQLTTIGEEVYIKYFHLEKYPVDEDDIAFVLCAFNGEATYLITYDAHLLEINEYYEFHICKPIEFLKKIREEN